MGRIFRAYKKLLIGGRGSINEEKFNVILGTSSYTPDLFPGTQKPQKTNLDTSSADEIEEDYNSVSSILGSRLEMFDISAVEYIGGCIVKKVALSLKCIHCFNFLLKQNEEKYLFTALKEKYLLLHPRKELVKIFKICGSKMKEIRDGNM